MISENRNRSGRDTPENASERATTRPDAPSRVTIQGPQGPGCLLDIAEPGPDAQIHVLLQSSTPMTNVTVKIGRIERGRLTIMLRDGDLELQIGSSGLMSGQITVCKEGKVTIGDGTTAQLMSVVARRGKVMIGKDCLIAGHVDIDASQHHGLVSLAGPQPELIDNRPDIRVGDHVWLGMRSMVLNHAQIGDGSIVGAGSVAAGTYPACVAIVGNPARIMREAVTWSRAPHVIDKATTDFIVASAKLSDGQTGSSAHVNTSI